MMLGLHTHSGSHGAVFCMKRGMQKSCGWDLGNEECVDLISFHCKTKYPGPGGVPSELYHYNPTYVLLKPEQPKL